MDVRVRGSVGIYPLNVYTHTYTTHIIPNILFTLYYMLVLCIVSLYVLYSFCCELSFSMCFPICFHCFGQVPSFMSGGLRTETSTTYYEATKSVLEGISRFFNV